MTTHKEKPRVAVVGHIKDAIMAYKGLEVEPVLRVTLDPAVPQIRNWKHECYMHNSPDGVTTCLFLFFLFLSFHLDMAMTGPEPARSPLTPADSS